MGPREPRISSRGGLLPFSKGRMAQTLTWSGLGAERAYQVSLLVEREVSEAGIDELSVAQLNDLVEAVLEREDPAMLQRYRRWHRASHLDRPMVLLLGGATGTGKSSLASEVAYRLGVSRVTSTDAVRQVMRAFFAPELMPALHYSSFEAGDGLSVPMPDLDPGDRALHGFILQAGQVAVGANAIIERAVMEGLSTVVEGVHLVPGLVSAERHQAATVVEVMLAIHDEELHQAHFFTRNFETGGLRSMDRYLRRFGEIRRIQDYLLARAERAGIPVIDAGDPGRALGDVLDLILERTESRSEVSVG
ncbi:MAG TPA: ATP cone domain-containing protein [Gaiellales bacterium]|nr:ATP cone domain-containing protein [Gaiellales bacterium]